MDRVELYQQLLEKNGRLVQCLKAIEEASEFIQAMAKLIGEEKGMAALIEETADLKIMIEQVEFMWGISQQVEEEMKMKLLRQEARMNEQD